jgi:hypothetical protein
VDDQSLRISGGEKAKIVGGTLGSRSDREHAERLSFWSPVPPFPSLAAVCVSARGPSFPSNPSTHFSVVDAMADRRESRPLGTEPTHRSKNRAASAAWFNQALAKTNVGKAAPPVVASAQVPPVPRWTVDTPETAIRQSLARKARAGSAADDLLITGPREEGGHAIAPIRASATGHPIARNSITTGAARGVRDLIAQAAQPPMTVFAPPTRTGEAKAPTTTPLPTTTAQSPKATAPKATATEATAPKATAKAAIPATLSKSIATSWNSPTVILWRRSLGPRRFLPVYERVAVAQCYNSRVGYESKRRRDGRRF